MFLRTILMILPLLASCSTAGDAAIQLAGSKWAFVSIDGRAAVSSRAMLTIEATRISATVGCNGLGGDLKIAGDRLVTGPIIGTQMYCDGVMVQEHAVSELLSKTPRYRVKGDKLTLTAAGHSAELTRLR